MWLMLPGVMWRVAWHHALYGLDLWLLPWRGYRPTGGIMSIYIYAVRLYASWCSLLHTWQVFHGGDGLLGAEVYDEQMRCRGRLLCLPVG